MSNKQKLINIVLGTILCGFLMYGCWNIPNIIGVDVSLAELEAQNPSLSTKVLVWRVVSVLLVTGLFYWIVRKNLRPKV